MHKYHLGLLTSKPVDFRKQINGLSLLVQDETLELDLFSEACFVFINRGRDRIKILYWQKNGFCLWMKRYQKSINFLGQNTLMNLLLESLNLNFNGYWKASISGDNHLIKRLKYTAV